MAASKKELLYQTLRQAILTLQIAPGEVLDEQRLSEEHGVSRTPLREVFQRLSGEGYLELRENRGARVAPMDLETMRRFFQTAPMIYASTTRLAAEGAQPQDVVSLKAIQKSFRQALETQDVVGTAIQNHKFHEEIGRIAANPYLQPALNRLLIDHTRMSQTFYAPLHAGDEVRIKLACDQHDEIITSIANRDPARAVELTLNHWALSRDEIGRYVSPDPLPSFSTETYGDRLSDAV